MNNVYTNAVCIYDTKLLCKRYGLKYHVSFKTEPAICYWTGNTYYWKWRKQFAEFKKILLGLVKVNQHFRDHMHVHHQGSDMLNETVSSSQALVYSILCMSQLAV